MDRRGWHASTVGLGRGVGVLDRKPVAQCLVAVGVGLLVLVDDDVVEEVNFNQQVIHRMGTVGTPKTESAAAALRDLNPTITAETGPAA